MSNRAAAALAGSFSVSYLAINLAETPNRCGTVSGTYFSLPPTQKIAMISASAAAAAPYNEAVMAGGDDAGSPALLRPMQPE